VEKTDLTIVNVGHACTEIGTALDLFGLPEIGAVGNSIGEASDIVATVFDCAAGFAGGGWSDCMQDGLGLL
jgi:hypothetical protein